MNEKDVERLAAVADAVREEIRKVMVGQRTVIEEVLGCLFAGGHILIEGVPGLGKTSLVQALSGATGVQTSRIQFTPDLMPADILGTDVLVRDDNGATDVVFRKGPLFSSMILADEINRATPKTQSALLEAMQESAVTIGGTRYALDQPFMVLATQNPLEMEGTYPLPEAQMDRFLYKTIVDYPDRGELSSILERTTGADILSTEARAGGDDVMAIRALVRNIPVPVQVRDYAVSLVLATHPGGGVSDVDRFIRYGASPRAAQALLLGAKAAAFLEGRYNASLDDIRGVAAPALRHRLILSFEGEAEGITTDDIVKKVLESVAS